MRRLKVAAVTLGVALAGSASAQVPVEPERLPSLGRSVAGTDDTTAIVQNPANLAYLPGAEFRWEGIYLDDTLTAPYQGHALSFGFRMPFALATGLRLDLVDPPDRAFGGLSNNYQWLTWALAVGASESLALGASVQRSYSDGPVADALGSYTLGLSARPFSLVGLSIVANHVNGPLEGAASRRLAVLGAPNVGLGPSITTALAIRPFGRRWLELGVEGKMLLDESGAWEPRGTIGLDIPSVGRLHGDFVAFDPEANELSWRASASLSLYLNGASGSTEVEGGAVTGTELGKKDSYNFWNGVALKGYREPVGIGPRRSAVRIRMESTPDSREHVALLRRLWTLAKDDDVAAVVFELRTSPADSLAHVQELRDAVRVLQAYGKKTLCHLEDASGSALYFCAATDRTLLNPAGGIRFAGLRMRHFYFAKVLENLGIQADFVRIGDHKSAPERFTREGASDVSRADTIDLLQQNERWLVGDIARDRKIPVEALRERLAKGPFVASEAKAAGLIDGFAFDDEVERAVSLLAGEPLSVTDADRAAVAPEKFGKQRAIAMVYVDGDIIDGRSRSVPLLGMDMAGSYTIAETLRKVRESPLIASVVLRVESPGGSSMASDVMWREVALTARVKPVIVSMGDIAASGGYYVAAPATKIYANPLTITGSIGVFYGKADVSGLMKKIGVNVEVYKTAPRADAESIFRPFTAEERLELDHKVGQFYEVFLSRVTEGRHLSRDAVDRIGRGRVWTGEQAKANGLVDELGGIRQALAEARKRGHLADDAPVIELPKIETSLLGRILGVRGLHAESGAAELIPPQITQLVRAMGPFLVHPADRPLSRIEITPVEP